MKTQRIYIDTSVLGGCFDAEFAPWSTSLMQQFRAGKFRAVLSEVTAAEVMSAPAEVRELHAEILALPAEFLAVTADALSLAATYEARSVLGERFRNDMLHIAVATVAEVDLLVSWNFRHIVRFDKIRLFSAVNLALGYRALAIYSPREVSVEDED